MMAMEFVQGGEVLCLFVWSPDEEGNDEGASWVIVRIELDLVGEITWPGSIDIGTRVEKVGRSSVTMQQGLFQAGRPVARATTVIVQMDDETRGSRALSEQLAERFRALQG